MIRKAAALSLLLLLTMSLASFAAPAGLWAQWILSPEYLSGDTLNAAYGRGGRLEGPLSFTEGPYGKSWYNFGQNHILIYKGGNEGIALPKDQITVEFWAKTDSNFSQQGVVNYFQDNGSFERGFQLGFSNYKVEAGVATAGNQGSTPYLDYIRASINVGEWYHIAYTYDGKTAKLYVNGRLADQSERVYGPIAYAESASLVLGAYLDDNEKDHLIGAVREVRIYSRVLSEAEILASKPGIVEEAKQMANVKGNSVVIVLEGGKTVNGSLMQVEGDHVLIALQGGTSTQRIAMMDIIAILPIRLLTLQF